MEKILLTSILSFVISVSSLSAWADEDLSKPLFPVDPAKYCFQNSQGQYVGSFQVIAGDSGRIEGQSFVFGEGGGCIFRPLRDAWGVTHNQPAMVWGGVDESTFIGQDPVSGASHHYQVQYKVKDFITVKWTMDWHHGLMEGTLLEPKQISLNYRKTSGTTFIKYWEGTLVLRELAPGVTGFIMRNQINASQTTKDDAASTVHDVYEKLTNASPNYEPITPKP